MTTIFDNSWQFRVLTLFLTVSDQTELPKMAPNVVKLTEASKIENLTTGVKFVKFTVTLSNYSGKFSNVKVKLSKYSEPMSNLVNF